MFATNDLVVTVWEASYLPFGGVQTSTGTPMELRFPGQWFQSESGLHQNWMRDYDPTTGRYIQADPLGLIPGPSLYGYAYQNPGRYIDPDGQNPVVACILHPACRVAAGAAVGVLVGWYFDDDECYSWGEAFEDGLMGAVVAAPHYWWSRRAGGGGARAWRNAPGVDWHRFTYNGRSVNRPHYHAGRNSSQMKKHRPWQGGWSLGGWRPW